MSPLLDYLNYKLNVENKSVSSVWSRRVMPHIPHVNQWLSHFDLRNIRFIKHCKRIPWKIISLVLERSQRLLAQYLRDSYWLFTCLSLSQPLFVLSSLSYSPVSPSFSVLSFIFICNFKLRKMTISSTKLVFFVCLPRFDKFWHWGRQKITQL